MKVLLSIQGFGGGAPLSILQYGMALKKCGFTVSISGAKNQEYIAEKYIEKGIDVIYSKRIAPLKKRQIFKLYKAVLNIYNIIILGKYDVAISVGNANNFFYSYICKFFKIKHLIIVPGGDIKRSIRFIGYWSKEMAICFSQENKEVALLGGYPKNKIHVISNRITAEEDVDWKMHYVEMGKSQPIILLMASRHDKDKVKSIKATMELAKWLFKNQLNVILRIAGNGQSFDEIKHFANTINQEVGNEFISVLGHVTNIKDEFKKAHFVFGKGRSILEPLMMNRIGFVVGENQKFSLCNENSFNNLYHYNFGGRNITSPITKDEIKCLITKVLYGEFSIDSFYDTFERVRLKYHTNGFENQFLPVFDEVLKVCEENREPPKRLFRHKLLLAMVVLRYISISIISMVDRKKRR